ncbi:MAG: M56 family metallopeptidase [Candidatus Zixiibacteriota bacterium]|nr:MAG: M56 family metallopeptidase [candidate division Zixibacteria bacterium]
MIESIPEALRPYMATMTKVLFHSLWQGGLAALLLGAALAFLRQSQARLRYLLSCLALVSVVAVSTATGIGLFRQHISEAPVTTVAAQVNHAAEAIVPENAATTPVAVTEQGSFSLAHLHDWVFPLWLLGVILMSLYHVFGWFRVRRLAVREPVEYPARWKEQFARLCARMHITRPVQLICSRRALAPCVIGLVKPVVLVPLSMFSNLEPSDIEMILVHELAHVRRYDILVNILQTVIETALFFNPAVWWISQQIRVEREHCCDDVVVQHSGDRVSYARALASLEELRSVRTGFVAAAAGMPLLARVRRLFGLPTVPNRSARLGAAGVVLLTVLTGVGMLSFPAVSRTLSETFVETTEPYKPQSDDIRGRWEIETYGGRAHINMRFKRRWETGFTVRARELLSEISQTTTHLEMRRDAGTFHFVGDFEEDDEEWWGEGECFFRANSEYLEEMDRLGFDIDDDEDVLSLAIHNVTLEFVRGLIDLGYDDLTYDELITAHIHDVTPEYIKEMNGLGYRNLKMDELVTMQIHDVEPDFVLQLAELGYRDLDADELVTMQIHDVEPELIEAYTSLGYRDLDVDELVTMQIHDVEPEFIEEMAELGYRDLDVDDLVTMQIHDVDPYFIKEMSDLGYGDLSVDRLVEMRIHDVDPDIVRALSELGYQNLSARRLVEMQIHDVDASYIRRLAELGYRDISPSRLVEMKIHNVSPRYISDLAELGYDDISPSTLVEMKIHGVSAAYVKKCLERTGKRISPRELVERKIHGY